MDVNKQLLDAIKPFADAYGCWTGGAAQHHFGVSVVPAHFRAAAIAYQQAIAAAEQAQQAEPVAWEVLNGVVSHDVYCSKADAEEVALDMQKAHDLSGSFAAFNVRPLYAQPPAVAVPDGWQLVPKKPTRYMTDTMRTFIKCGWSDSENGRRPMSALYSEILEAVPPLAAASQKGGAAC